MTLSSSVQRPENTGRTFGLASPKGARMTAVDILTTVNTIKLAKTIFISLLISLILISNAFGEDKGVIKIGISTSFRPFNYIDENGEISGYNADVARAICAQIPAKCQFVPMPFSEIIASLEQNKIQIAASNLLYTEARAQRINFSDKYYRSTTSLVGASEDSTKDPVSILSEGKRILVVKGSTQWQYLRSNSNAQIIQVTSIRDGLNALNSQQADYALLPTLFALHNLQLSENSHLDFIGLPVNAPSLEGDVHLGLTKAVPGLQNKVNKALKELVESGELRTLINKYFPFNVY